MTLLFSPLTLGKLKLVNRLCVPPMCQYRAKDRMDFNCARNILFVESS